MATSQKKGHAEAVQGERRGRRSLNQRGFTLIELLTSMAIIAILMAMVLGAGVFAKRTATRARARAELQELHNALQKFRIDTGAYPITADLNLVRPKLPRALQSRFDGRDASVLRDPWKRPFEYAFDPKNPEAYVLYSKGPNDIVDGKELTDDDIYSGK